MAGELEVSPRQRTYSLPAPSPTRERERSEAIKRRREAIFGESEPSMIASLPGIIPAGAPRFAGRVFADASGQIIDPADVSAEMATELGRQAGMIQVANRLARSPGFYAGPGNAQMGTATLGTGAGLTNPFQFVPDVDMSRRVRDIGDAVRRRLEQLTNPAPATSPFTSPGSNPENPPWNTRGRFGTWAPWTAYGRGA